MPPAGGALSAPPASLASMKIGTCEFPDGLLYDPVRGVWGRPDGGTMRIGITAVISWSLGAFSRVSCKEAGTPLAPGQVLGSLDGSRNFEVVRSPVSGVVAAVNPRLAGEPELANRDSYGEGWLAEVTLADPSDLGGLVPLASARDAIAAMAAERKVRCFSAFPDYEMYSVGMECSSVLVKLGELLANSGAGSVAHVVSDDTGSEAQVRRWSEATGNPLLDFRQEGPFYHFIVRKG